MSTPLTKEYHFAHLKHLCPQYYDPSSPEYPSHAAPWSIHADLHPPLVLVPSTPQELSSILAYICPYPDLDFCIRNTGTGGASARDICISMANFKSLSFDAETETVIVGAGLSFGEVDVLMEEHAPGLAVLSARCTWVGVAGGTLNFLDAEGVLIDGRIIRSIVKEEPELMWALRGGGGGFVVLTSLTLRARPVPANIFGGVVLVPYSSLRETSKAVAEMHAAPANPKLALHVMNQGPSTGMPDQGPRPGLLLMPIDFLGETHARSAGGFAWIWNLPGAVEVTSFSHSFRGINALNDTFKNLQGRNKFWASGAMVSGIDEEMLVRAWKWYEDCYHLYPGFGVGSTVLLEFMQEGAFNSVKGPGETAWPHGRGRRHVLQVLLGCEEGSPEGVRDIAMKRFQSLGREVAGEYATGEFHAGFLHEWNDLEEVYGRENSGRLREVKRRFDPGNRLDKGIDSGRGRSRRG